MLSEKTIADLIVSAKRKAWYDDDEFNANDYSGGNFDDAYYGGTEDGGTQMARDILDELGIKY
jgi:hypothetical protein